MGAPRLEQLADLPGIETEVAIAPDGTRLIAVASGDLWLLNATDGSRQQLTNTPEAEASPAWAPDGSRLSFSRSGNVLAAAPSDLEHATVLKENATALGWSPTGRLAFVRERALWLTDAGGRGDQEIVPADPSEDVTISQPRFSPDSLQIAFVKTTRNLFGEVWIADAASGAVRPLIADRVGENPIDVGWLEDGKLVYLTNRSGGYALWIFDLGENVLTPLTMPLDGVGWQHTGIAVHGERIIIARHLLDSDIVLSDGSVVAATEDLEFQPAVSPSGRLVAYTLQKGNNFEVWTAGIDGGAPTFRAAGAEPRFAANDYQIVYTHTDVQGRVDLRRVDIRDGRSASVTDAPEVDFQPDWSPDGRTIAFSSNSGNGMRLWQVPATGGKRLPVHDQSGFFPRFSPDGQRLAYWDKSAVWTIHLDTGMVRKLRDGITHPSPVVWVGREPRHFSDPEVNGGKTIWPTFDALPDGRVVYAPIEIQETSLWSVELTYTE